MRFRADYKVNRGTHSLELSTHEQNSGPDTALATLRALKMTLAITQQYFSQGSEAAMFLLVHLEEGFSTQVHISEKFKRTMESWNQSQSSVVTVT